MKVTLRSRTMSPNTARLTADVVWEDASRPPTEIYFEVPVDWAD